METKTFKKGSLIFKAGDPGDCMYEVYMGKVGIYSDFGTDREKLLTEYYQDQYFGEMGLLDKMPRSATAVAMCDGTSLGIITEENFDAFYRENPNRVLMVMQQISKNLRKRTKEYMDVCRQIKKLTETEASE